jgi:hypothetical protein
MEGRLVLIASVDRCGRVLNPVFGNEPGMDRLCPVTAEVHERKDNSLYVGLAINI